MCRRARDRTDEQIPEPQREQDFDQGNPPSRMGPTNKSAESFVETTNSCERNSTRRRTGSRFKVKEFSPNCRWEADSTRRCRSGGGSSSLIGRLRFAQAETRTVNRRKFAVGRKPGKSQHRGFARGLRSRYRADPARTRWTLYRSNGATRITSSSTGSSSTYSPMLPFDRGVSAQAAASGA